MPVPLREESPRWLALLEFLQAHGGTSGKGCRMRQDDIAAGVGMPVTACHDYLKQMEKHELLTVRRTTVDGSFGSPRGANIYRLRCTPEQWVSLVGPAVIADVRERITKRRTLLNRNMARERQRKNLERKAAELGLEVGAPDTARRVAAAPRATTAVVAEPTFAPHELAELVDRYTAGDEDLDGW